MNNLFSRRRAILAAGGAAAAAILGRSASAAEIPQVAESAVVNGRIKQAACKWCYGGFASTRSRPTASRSA